MAAVEPHILEAIPADVVALCERLRAHGKRGWVVGGCVRDLLRGVPATDWDIATDARPGQVRRVFGKVIPTGIKHGTVTVLLHGKAYEVTTLRGEGVYVDGRRPERVEFIDDIVQDLARRDFTFNAIAIDPLEGALVDPFGGQRDLDARIVRAVGDALERFREDGLRVLRAARFAATLECAIEPGTLVAMQAPSSLDTFAKVSAERIHDEWLKTMRALRPSVAFAIMQDTGILARIAPELCATLDVSLPEGLDVWSHSLRTLDACPPDPVLRVAALLHDIGKPGSPMDDHTERGAQRCDELLRRLKFSNEDRERIVHVVRHHCIGDPSGWSDAEVRRWIRRVGVERLADVIAVARAGAEHGGAGSAEAIVALEQRAAALRSRMVLSTRELAVDGKTLMRELGLGPSRRVGELLNELLEMVTDEPHKNDREVLLAAARDLQARAGGEP